MAFGGKRGLVPYSKAWEQDDSSGEESSASDIEDYQQQTPISAPPPKFGGKRFHGKGAALHYAYHANASSAAHESESEYDDDSEEENTHKKIIAKPKFHHEDKKEVKQTSLLVQPKAIETVQTTPRPSNNISDPSSLLAIPSSSGNLRKFPGKGARILQQFSAIDRLSDDEDDDSEAEFEADITERKTTTTPPPPPPPPPPLSKEQRKDQSIKPSDVNNNTKSVSFEKRETNSTKNQPKIAIETKKLLSNKRKKKSNITSTTKRQKQHGNINKEQKPIVSIEEELHEILPIVAKIPKLKHWMETTKKTTDDVIYKLVGYLLKIGDFVEKVAAKNSSRNDETYWQSIADKLPKDITGMKLLSLFNEMKKQVV